MNEIVQYFYNSSLSKQRRSELLKKVDVDYCIPDTPSDKEPRRRNVGYTILHLAAWFNHVDLVDELLRLGADVVKQGTRDGSTPLHVAAKGMRIYRKSGQLEKEVLINTLLSRQVKINNTLNPKCEDGVSHFHIACMVNHAEAVEFFAKAKEPLDQPTNSNIFWLPGYTPLHCAIRYSSVEAVQILLRHGADLHAKNSDNMSCLHFLIKRMLNMTDFIKIGKRTLSMPYEEEIRRLESIIDLVQKTRGNYGTFLDETGLLPLHVACTLRDKTVVEDVLKKGISANLPVKSESKFWSGWTPLHFAACALDIGMMMLLMKKSADIMIENAKGETAFDFCVKQFSAADVQLILSMENQFKNIVLSDNSTRLSDLLLVMNDCDDFRDFLRKLKIINVTVPQDSSIWPGYNLLHISVSLNEKTKSLSDSEELLDLPSETTDVTDPYNCTPQEEALYSKRIELLLEHGCAVNMKNANGQTPIHLAFATYRESTVNELLSHSKENVVDRNGLSHLHIACMLGHLDAVERYLSGGVEVDSRVTSGFERRETRRNIIFHLFNVETWKSVRADSTSLHLAALFGQKKVVESLLANNADVYARDSLGFTPIHLAMLTQPPAWETVANLLLEATPNLRDCVSSVGLSHLHVAAWANNHKAVEDLLRNGAEIDRVIDPNVEQSYPFLKDWAGKTPLLVAANAEAGVETLLNAGANVLHAENSRGPSALQLAMRDMTQAFVVPFIRKVKAGECDVESCGMTRLHVACADCDLEWAEQLLENGADVNARIDDERNVLHGATPLHVLLYYSIMTDVNDQGLVDFVEMLVRCGAELLAVQASGSTPLHLIYEYTHYDAFSDLVVIGSEFLLLAVDFLLRNLKSYDINPVNHQGLSHFHLACVRNDVETAAKFLDHGADVNETMDPFDQTGYGFAPLHSAMAYRCSEVAYLLLERGADVNAVDVHGNTPLHVAMKTKFVDLPLIEAVIAHGADYRAKNLNDETLLYCLLKFSNLTLDEYLQFFELWMGYGYDFDREDKEGTPLNEAALFDNLEAVEALLQLGADMNTLDFESEFPLNEVDAFNQRQLEVLDTLICHVWKMRFIGLEVRESNLIYLERGEDSFMVFSPLVPVCQDELKKAAETEICQGMTVKDFLSELGAVAEYPRMSTIRRGIVDKFFKQTADLRLEFPEFCGFLAIQYKKIRPRMELWQPTKRAIYFISKIDLPDLCIEAILRFFTNSDMELLIESVKELM